MSASLILIIALLMGASVGLEREAYEKKEQKKKTGHSGSFGIRSFSLISFLGAIAGISLKTHPLICIIISAIVGVLLFLYYILGSNLTKDIGITTELAILVSYINGILLGSSLFPAQMVIAITVILILILSLKDEIRSFIAGIKEFEIDAFISYAIIALVILPFLPDVSYTLSQIPGASLVLRGQFAKLLSIELINPAGLWRVVAIITGIEVFGYFLEKTVGQKGGWLLTSIAGGFISSTSTTQSLAIKSKKGKSINRLVSAALFANTASFIQHILLIAPINPPLLINSLPFIMGLILVGGVLALFLMRKKDKAGEKNFTDTKKKLEKDTIFSLKPALQFAILFLVIKFIAKASLVLFGSNIFFITVVFSSLAGIDAITLNIGELAGKLISLDTATIALMLANTTNLLAKSLYAYMLGSRSFAKSFFVSIVMVIAGGLLGLIFLLQ